MLLADRYGDSGRVQGRGQQLPSQEMNKGFSLALGMDSLNMARCAPGTALTPSATPL
jgi:hypothetical protein